MRSTLRSKRVTCDSGAVPFSAFLNGTRRAPFRDGRMATGRYVADGRRLDFRRFRTNAPGRQVTRLRFRWRARCDSGGTYASTRFFDPLLLREKSASLVLSARLRGRVEGARALERSRLELRFLRRGRRYLVRGSWRATVVLRRGGRRVDTCRTGTLRFRGRFRSGPPRLTG